MELDTLKQYIQASLDLLSATRKRYAQLKQQLQDKREDFDRSISDLILTKEETEKSLENIERQIRQYAMQVYTQTQEKDIYEGKVKERDVTDITLNYENALKWCMDHALFLKVDDKSLITFLRAQLKEGVLPEALDKLATIKHTQQITITNKLD